MTPEIRIFTGFTAAFAVAAALAAAPPAQSMTMDPASPERKATSVFPKSGMDHRAIEAALAQEQYYQSQKPAGVESGVDVETQYSGRDLRTIDARDAADAPGGAVTHVTAPATAPAATSSGFELDDAAIGAGSALGLVLVLAGGAAVVSRRRTPATP